MKKNFKTLEVGKTYRRRDGEVVKISTKTTDEIYPFICSRRLNYTSSGHFWESMKKYYADLIELVEEPKQTNSSPDYELFEEIERLEGINQFLTQALNAEKAKVTEHHFAVALLIDDIQTENNLLKLDVESNSILSGYLYNQIKELNWFQKLIFGYGKYRDIVTTYQIFRDNGFRPSKSKQSNTGVINQAKAYENGTSKGY